MKKINYLVMILLFCSIFVSSMSQLTVVSASSIDLTIDLRVGLKELYEMKDTITINNQSLIIGYEMDGQWKAEHELNSDSGYIITAAPGFFLISQNYYSTYIECETKISLLREQGFDAYTASVASGIWKVYIGSLATEIEALELLNGVNGALDITYEVVADNGLRTRLEYSEGYPIILENSNPNSQFSTNDLINGIAIVNLGERSYRGRIEIGRYQKKGVTAINVVDLNDYLYGVVPSEMPSSWPTEALKAQAVAVRNYAIYYTYISRKYPNEAYSICDTVNSQAYKGFNAEATTCIQAVNETTGKLIYFGETIIPAYFFSTSGGHTENSENVWSGTVGYLKGIPDIYEVQPTKEPWIQTITALDIKTALTKYEVNIGDIVDVSVPGYTDSGRAMSLLITGTTGEYEIKKETMRVWLGLKSRKFTLVKSTDTGQKSFYVLDNLNQTKQIEASKLYAINGSNISNTLSTNLQQLSIFTGSNIHSIPLIGGVKDSYIFVGQGYGHGVGMSQSGAKGMALNGFTYEEILEYYYSGTQVK